MTAILDCFSHWSVPAQSEEVLGTADVIVTHEFGDQQTVSASTEGIVRRGALLAQSLHRPLICQSPGHRVAEELGVTPIKVIEKSRVEGAYLDTEEVNGQVAQMCWQKGWKKVIVCTHPHHLWRAGLNLKRYGLEPFYPYTADISYDSACSRIALRSPWVFIPREILARMLYAKKGYI